MKKKNVDADILMIHGDADEIVSPNFLLEAKDFFIRNNVNVETQLIKNCGHWTQSEKPDELFGFMKDWLEKRFPV